MPIVTGKNPDSFKHSTSSSVKSPSGPMATEILLEILTSDNLSFASGKRTILVSAFVDLDHSLIPVGEAISGIQFSFRFFLLFQQSGAFQPSWNIP